MTDTLMALVPLYGVWLLAIITFLSCLAVPVPSSLLMVAGGAFAAAGDLSLGTLGLAAFLGAVAGDQTGFFIGRHGFGFIGRLQAGSAKRKILWRRARGLSASWGGTGVFLSRWLLSPLGPYINFVGGASGMKWRAFTLAATVGELIWVSLYVGLGYVFTEQIELVVEIAGNLSGFLVAGAVAFILGRLVSRSANGSDSEFESE